MKRLLIFLCAVILLSLTSIAAAQSDELPVLDIPDDLVLPGPCLENPLLCDLGPIDHLLKPDLTVAEIASGGCTGTAGDPVVSVTVRNNGIRSAKAWVDVFPDRPSAPSLGDLSPIYRMSPVLNGSSSERMWFTVDRRFQNSTIWMDVIIDTVDEVDESDEDNNIMSRRISLPDCSFN